MSDDAIFVSDDHCQLIFGDLMGQVGYWLHLRSDSIPAIALCAHCDSLENKYSAIRIHLLHRFSALRVGGSSVHLETMYHTLLVDRYIECLASNRCSLVLSQLLISPVSCECFAIEC